MTRTCLVLIPLLLSITLLSKDAKPAPITLEDTEARSHKLPPNGDNKATVLFFTAIECPLANRYTSRIVTLHKELAPRGVGFYAVYSHAFEMPADIRKHALEAGYGFPACSIRPSGPPTDSR